MANYMENIGQYPVRANSRPGEISAQFPPNPPENANQFEDIFKQFEDIILPGVTHWQHPGFFAYFSATTSPASILGEMLTSALALQCMSWQTSPAGTELETVVMKWLARATGLPDEFEGVIQDSASSATLCAILNARERVTNYQTNEHGFEPHTRLTVYCSAEAHSSVEKAVRIAGIGSANLRKIAVDSALSMNSRCLKDAIEYDLAQGHKPTCVVATIGSTGGSGFDNLVDIGKLCKANNIWLHVDAAWAGSALILPEFRYLIDGVENADSLVFNPHKWLYTSFDCSAFFVKDSDALIRTLSINPEYLKTREDDDVINYRDWSIPLGRRFRALKLWMVLNLYGLNGLRELQRKSIALTKRFAEKIEKSDDFELLVKPTLSLLCFRYRPQASLSAAELDAANRELMELINDSGQIYLTHTRINDQFVLRFTVGNIKTEQAHIDSAWELINEKISQLKAC